MRFKTAGLLLLMIGLWAAQVANVRADACMASFYGTESGHWTATGERFNPRGMTAAHRSLAFGTRLRVSFGGRSVVVRINDRGPAKWTGRCLDLAAGAAHAVGLPGVGLVHFERIGK